MVCNSFQTFAQLDLAPSTRDGTRYESPGPKGLHGRRAQVDNPSAVLADRINASAWAFKSHKTSSNCIIVHISKELLFILQQFENKSKVYWHASIQNLNQDILYMDIAKIHCQRIYHGHHQRPHPQNCYIWVVPLHSHGKHLWYFSHLPYRFQW